MRNDWRLEATTTMASDSQILLFHCRFKKTTMPIPQDDPIVNLPMITPFDDQDQIDHAAIERNVEKWLAAGKTVDAAEVPRSNGAVGIFLVGSASGEEWFLNEDDKLEIASTVKHTLGADRCLMGGIDCPSVTETLRRAEAFAERGAELVRIRIPRYESVVLDYFKHVVPRCPVPILLMHQSNPEKFGFAGTPAATPEVVGEICEMDGVFGYTTDHDVRYEWRVGQQIPVGKRFWICNGSLILQGTLIGCNGTTTAFSNIWPAALSEMLSLGMAGRFQEAQDLQTHIQKIDAIMLPYQAAGVKAAMNLLGFEGTRPRQPTKPFPESQIPELETAIRNAKLLT
jgi:dihydrodipicolinate synthase/N-acetylneuraminate lyase